MLWLTLALLGVAQTPPARHVPPSVLGEVRAIEQRFEIALAADCPAPRCAPRGCAYLDHAVADQPRAASLPGLGEEAGPGSAPEQAWLTQANCSFAYEGEMAAADAAALARRLSVKLSGSWTAVRVEPKLLEALPLGLTEVEEVPPEVPPEAPAPWSPWRELWAALLPHFFWMVGVLLVTFAASLLIWAWRRVGQPSVEERMLLAELASAPPAETPVAPTSSEEATAPDAAAYVEAQGRAWEARLAAFDPAHPDPELQYLSGALLREGARPLLAKAMLRFPATFHATFPQDGALATAKLELAAFLQEVDPAALPSEEALFRALEPRALAAALTAQSDAQVMASLRDDFGAAGLISLSAQVSPRAGALLLVLAPPELAAEVVRMLSLERAEGLAAALMISNRVSPVERGYLHEVVSAARLGATLPPAPAPTQGRDQGAPIDAEGVLSLLLEALPTVRREALFGVALQAGVGALPAWMRGVLVPEWLLLLADETRADLFLSVAVGPLAAWLALRPDDTRERLLSGAPNALRAALSAPLGERLHARAREGQRALSAALVQELNRSHRTFESVVRGQGAAR